jgi:tetratricopeptide (TPR) repeat protein
MGIRTFIEAAHAEMVSPPEETGLGALADLEHPWLGLESFREETRAYFFGRGEEIDEIHLRLRSHPLLVLYGRSGLGKTSILNAGLVSRLREEGQRPSLIRLDYKKKIYGPCNQLFFALSDSKQGGPTPFLSTVIQSVRWIRDVNDSLANSPPPEQPSQPSQPFSLPRDAPSRLWLRLHWRKEPPHTTHLILDQFEEVFTLGAIRPGAEHEVRDALAIILQGAIPEAISRLIAEHDVFLDHFDPDSMPVRVVLALRDDYVYALNRWQGHLSALGQNNFELRALRGPAAFDAVFKPGELRCKYRGGISEQNKMDTGLSPIVSKDTAERIVRFVARKGEDVPLEEIEAVPPILSLLCREFNERRFTEPGGTPELPAQEIIFSESEADVETIIKAFYERCLVDQPEAVRLFIEEELVSYSGARLAQDEKSILSCFEKGWEIPRAHDGRRAAGFGDAAKARECLKDLVNQRLLSSLGGGENPSYELIHDLLAAVAAKSRTVREERSEKEEASRRASLERKAREKAEAAKNRAEKLIEFVTFDLRDKLQPIGRLNLLDDVNRSVQAYYDSFAAEDETPEILRPRSVMFENQGDVLRAQGDLPGALKSYRDSFAIREKLSKQDPGNADWQRNLSLSYIRLGDVQRDQGDLAGALKSYRDSLAIAEKLSKQEPGNAGWQSDLSFSHSRVGDVQGDQGDLAGALKSYRDSLAIRETLSKQDPGNTGWQSDLSFSYDNVGDVQRDQGDLAGALKSYRDSLAIREKLSKQDPSNTSWQRDLSFSYDNVGNVQRDQGDLAGALKSYRGSLAIREKLSKQDPSNTGWQRNLSVSYDNVGNVQRDQGDLAGALKSHRDSLAIAEKLSKQDPGNTGWQRDLSISYDNVGNVQRDQGDLAGALKSYRDSLAIREKLSKQDPGNAGWQRDLSVGYNNVGNVQRDQGDLAGALKSYNDGQATMEKLVKQDPSNFGWQSDISDWYADIGKLLRDQGDFVGALKNYRESLGIRDKLAIRDLSNVGWQAALGWIYWQTGAVLEKVELGSKGEVLAMVQKGHDILRQLKERTGLTVEQQKWLDESETDLDRMREANR